MKVKRIYRILEKKGPLNGLIFPFNGPFIVRNLVYKFRAGTTTETVLARKYSLDI